MVGVLAEVVVEGIVRSSVHVSVSASVVYPGYVRVGYISSVVDVVLVVIVVSWVHEESRYVGYTSVGVVLLVLVVTSSVHVSVLVEVSLRDVSYRGEVGVLDNSLIVGVVKVGGGMELVYGTPVIGLERDGGMLPEPSELDGDIEVEAVSFDDSGGDGGTVGYDADSGLL